MYLEMFLRIFSDCCLLFALLGCCPSVIPYSFPLPVACLICGAAAGLAAFFSGRSKRTLACVCAVLPLFSLLLANGWKEMIILAPPIVYTCAVILLDKLFLEYYSFRRYLQRITVFMLVAWAAISIIIFLEDPRGLEEQIIFPNNILKYTIAAFLCGVLLQRKLRLGEGNRTYGELSQIITVGGGVGAVCVGILATEPVIESWLHTLLKTVGPVVFLPFIILAEIVTYIMNLIFQYLEKHGYEEALDQKANDNGIPHYPATYAPGENDPLDNPKEPGHSPWVMVVTIIIVVILAVLMIIAFAKLREKKTMSLKLSSVRGERKKKQRAQLSNRKKVRQMYREFLTIEQKRGTILKKRYTTADILARTSRYTDREAASQLRQAYLGARYNEEREVDRSQVNEARAAIRKIRKEIEES